MKIKLNELENTFFEELKVIIRAEGISSVYVTGGWVRDKLLGNDSLDIDLATSKENIEKLVCGLK